MILYSKIINGKHVFTNQRELEEYLEKNKNYKGYFVHQISKTTHERTSPQNRSLHLYFTHLAKELNDAGFNVQKLLKHTIEIDWNEKLIKELLWRPVQIALLGKNSTKDLEKVGEIEVVYEHINRYVGELAQVYVPWPSEENKPTIHS